MTDSTSELDLHAPRVHAALESYWRQNLRIMAMLLALWAAVSFGCGILIADWLNQFRLPLTGFPLGFWFAQQGAIYVFVLLIFAYVYLMNRLDRRFRVNEPAARGGGDDASAGES